MISSEVQRTLVKSPPELWAELSNPDALARHLGELGEIRITRTEPEKTVEWEAENTTGTVSIQPSGWGTKVTLSVVKEVVGVDSEDAAELEVLAGPSAEALVQPEAPTAPEPAAAEPEVAPEPGAPAEPASDAPEPASAAAEPEAAVDREAPAVQDTAVDAPTPAGAAPGPRRGFFARLFGRKRKVDVTAHQPSVEQAPAAPTSEAPADEAIEEPSDPFAAVREALTAERVAAVELIAARPTTQPAPKDAAREPETKPEQVADIAAELRAAEEVTEEQVTAILAAALDRLGAAHHRPFSRS